MGAPLRRPVPRSASTESSSPSPPKVSEVKEHLTTGPLPRANRPQLGEEEGGKVGLFSAPLELGTYAVLPSCVRSCSSDRMFLL